MTGARCAPHVESPVSLGLVEQVAEIILEKHGKEHGQKAGERKNVGAVKPAKTLSADIVIATSEKVSGAKKLPRPQPRWKATVSRSLKVIGHGEDNECERRSKDDAALVCGAAAEPEGKTDGDGKPRRALEVVERLVSRWKGSAENREW